MNPLLIRRRGMMKAQGGGGVLVFHDKLVFDGISYIVTDIIPPVDFSVETNCGNETIKAPQRFMMCPATIGPIGFFMGSATSSTTRRWNAYYGASGAVLTNKALNFTQYPTYSIILTPKRFGFGNNTATFSKGNGVPNGFLHIGQNPELTGQPYSGYMSTIHIYDSTAQDATSVAELRTYTPVYTLRPCTYNGEAGLWNVEGSKFYGNSAGAGMLTVED